MTHVYAVIMAGGGGTRLWPLSRRARPKQLLALLGGRSLLEACAERVRPLVGSGRTLVVTTAEQVPGIRNVLPGLPTENLVGEPMGRNTGPCVGLAALHLAHRDPDAVMAVLPADHHVSDDDAFRQVVEKAARAVSTADRLVTVGIRPTRPETGYGYIHVGDPAAEDLYRALGFVEKPAAPKAREIFEGGKHLWNSGMFFFSARRILAEIRHHLPGLAVALDELGRALQQGAVEQAVSRIWPTLDPVSIDHGVMEKVDDFFVIPGDFGWSDVGSFTALAELMASDGDANQFQGDVTALDSAGNLALTEGRTIALLGVRDLVVVATADAVLVCPKGRAQDVKAVVDALEKRARKDLL